MWDQHPFFYDWSNESYQFGIWEGTAVEVNRKCGLFPFSRWWVCAMKGTDAIIMSLNLRKQSKDYLQANWWPTLDHTAIVSYGKHHCFLLWQIRRSLHSTMLHNAHTHAVLVALAHPWARCRAKSTVFILQQPAGQHLEIDWIENCNHSLNCF